MNNTLLLITKISDLLISAGIDEDVVKIYEESLLSQLSVDFVVLVEDLMKQDIFSKNEADIIRDNDNIFDLFQKFNSNSKVSEDISSYLQSKLIPMLISDIETMIKDPKVAKQILENLEEYIDSWSK